VTGAAAPDVPVYRETGDQTLQRQIDEAYEYLQRLAAGLRLNRHKVATEVLIEDEPDKAIIEYARRARSAFIAVLRRTHPSLPGG
jgi:hypothetical protein